MAFALVLAACSGGSTKAADAGAPSVDDPLSAVSAALDAINRRDVQAVIDSLSSDARASLTSEGQLTRLLAFLALRGQSLRLSVQDVGARAVAGDQAQITLTLLIEYRGQKYPLKDVAYLVREDGKWRLSDHFLQTALAIVGLGPQPAIAPRVFGPDGCVQGDILAGVYLPSRLQVLDPCLTVEGIVRDIEAPAAGEGDGDLAFDLELSGADQRLLNDGNRRNTGGWLHIEVVPGDQPRVKAPRVGQRVRVQGPWVLDLVHGHNEIHPAWSVQVLSP